jgi:hypothetical protein
MTKEERSEYNKKYNQINKEKNRKRHKEYHQANKESIHKRHKKYRESNKEYIKEIMKIYRKDNKEKINEYTKEYYKKNRENILKYAANYKKTNKNKRNEYERVRKSIDFDYKLKSNLRNIVAKIFIRKGFSKKSKTAEIIGCTFDEFKTYIESKFEDWMTWENYGKYNGNFNYGWDIDHIIPISEGKSEVDIVKLNHYTNLQPLCSKINRDIKKDKLIY